jgi:sec-independent protein translocase protein TatA
MTSCLIPLLSLPGGSEWIIIALVVLLLFGGKKIPELMKGLGKGVRSFKEGLNDASREIKDAADSAKETEEPSK